ACGLDGADSVGVGVTDAGDSVGNAVADGKADADGDTDGVPALVDVQATSSTASTTTNRMGLAMRTSLLQRESHSVVIALCQLVPPCPRNPSLYPRPVRRTSRPAPHVAAAPRLVYVARLCGDYRHLRG